MWPPTITDCECEHPGWCERHKCFKLAHWHHLCRRNETYFHLWEQGEGPCIPIGGESEEQNEAPQEPGLWKKSMNFGKAVVRHVSNGMQKVDEEQYESRLSTCRECPSCDLERLVCKQPECGCFLAKKARWRSERCPLDKWPRIEPVSDP